MKERRTKAEGNESIRQGAVLGQEGSGPIPGSSL